MAGQQRNSGDGHFADLRISDLTACVAEKRYTQGLAVTRKNVGQKPSSAKNCSFVESPRWLSDLRSKGTHWQ